ncbi:MAG TPA: hypothetical protein VNX21_07695 [Candidatus Thermoplasmatota archaeon]|nr:hypothetical protein [Candidatus Thermoplasmatota archaeon]
MVSTALQWGVVLSALLAGFGVLFFFQTKDPMVLLFGVQGAAWVWGIVLVVHVLRHGIPIRIVSDERKGP